MRFKTLLFLILLFVVKFLNAQIQGPDTVCVNSINVFSYVPTTNNGYTIWQSSGASFNRISSSDMEIQWSINGSFIITVYEYNANLIPIGSNTF